MTSDSSTTWDWLPTATQHLMSQLVDLASTGYRIYGRGCITLIHSAIPASIRTAVTSPLPFAVEAGYMALEKAHSEFKADSRLCGFIASYRPDEEFVLLGLMHESTAVASSIVPLSGVRSFYQVREGEK